MRLGLLLVTTLLLLPTLAGCVSEEEELEKFPDFNATADDGQIYNLEKMANSPFIVMFSAEWCNSPCYSTMHSMWSAEANLPVLVMSTDPAENAGGVTLEQWHESADAHDDEDENAGVNLSTYAFMKGDVIAQELGIKSPGTIMFVNSDGEITDTHVGLLEDKEAILDCWSTAKQ